MLFCSSFLKKTSENSHQLIANGVKDSDIVSQELHNKLKIIGARTLWTSVCKWPIHITHSHVIVRGLVWQCFWIHQPLKSPYNTCNIEALKQTHICTGQRSSQAKQLFLFKMHSPPHSTCATTEQWGERVPFTQSFITIYCMTYTKLRLHSEIKCMIVCTFNSELNKKLKAEV